MTNKMGGTCGTYVGREGYVPSLVGKYQTKRLLRNMAWLWTALSFLTSGTSCEEGDKYSGLKNAGNFLTGW